MLRVAELGRENAPVCGRRWIPDSGSPRAPDVAFRGVPELVDHSPFDQRQPLTRREEPVTIASHVHLPYERRAPSSFWISKPCPHPGHGSEQPPLLARADLWD